MVILAKGLTSIGAIDIIIGGAQSSRFGSTVMTLALIATLFGTFLFIP